MTRTMTTEEAAALPEGWTLAEDGTSISRRWRFPDFAAALARTALVGKVAEARNHHPDIRLGWGYCEVRFTTHDAGGLTRADLDAAAAVEAAIPAG